MVSRISAINRYVWRFQLFNRPVEKNTWKPSNWDNVPSGTRWGLQLKTRNKNTNTIWNHLQGGPLLVINEVITPISFKKNKKIKSLSHFSQDPLPKKIGLFENPRSWILFGRHQLCRHILWWKFCFDWIICRGRIMVGGESSVLIELFP